MSDAAPSTPLLPQRRTGVLFVLSAPSGAGKSTLRVGLQKTPDFAYSVSCTTRTPRAGETDGVDYHFLTRQAFEEQVRNGGFLEYAEVHGNYYGTLRRSIVEQLRQGVDVLVDIDTQGAARIRASTDPDIARAFVDLFLLPPDMEELRRRLTGRGTETDAEVELRLRNAEKEIAEWPLYRYAVPAGTVEEVLSSVRAIMRCERLATRRLSPP
ncbi:MAG TPA: guanylate kinase [Chthoniobacteraceae bacterium]|nr:guanylate kinase [Chthoniobacteraceae bacterium]